jgi:uncharacterized membrane protein YgcG
MPFLSMNSIFPNSSQSLSHSSPRHRTTFFPVPVALSPAGGAAPPPLLYTHIMLMEAARSRKRSWEPCDFFELANVEPPREDIEHGCHCLVYGPTGCGKTTLLFQHALAVTRNDADARVLFICRRSAIEAAPPLLPQAAAGGEPATRIHMKYLATDAQVCKLASLMHLLPPAELPSLIILDNFSGFFPGGGGGAGGGGGGGGGAGGAGGGYGGGGYGQYGGGGGERRDREMSFVRTIAALHECALSIRRRAGAASSSAAAGTSVAAASERSRRCLLLVSEGAEGDSDLPPMVELYKLNAVDP